MMSKLFKYLSLIIALFSVSFVFACGEPLHEHVFYKKNLFETYLASDATCTEPAKYYYSCDCGEHGEETFDDGEPLGHNYSKYTCTVCSAEEYSRGLKFKYDSSSATYTVIGIGTCTDTEIIIPSTYEGLPVTKIKDNAFYYSKMTKVVIKDNLTTIERSAFWGCSKLESIEIGNSVTSIGSYAFKDCTSLQEIVIPNNVTTIEEKAFFGCNDNLKINCEASSKPTNFNDDWNLYKIVKTGENVFEPFSYSPTWNHSAL